MKVSGQEKIRVGRGKTKNSYNFSSDLGNSQESKTPKRVTKNRHIPTQSFCVFSNIFYVIINRIIEYNYYLLSPIYYFSPIFC